MHLADLQAAEVHLADLYAAEVPSVEIPVGEPLVTVSVPFFDYLANDSVGRAAVVIYLQIN